MPRKFLNPYHFVPVGETPMTPTADVTPGKQLPPELRHDRYVPEGRSGRLICRLKVETPLVIGSSQEKRDPQPTVVHPYLVEEQPAVPAATLRGLISSIVEAASNSALRILEKRWPGGGGINILWPLKNNVPGPHDFFKAVSPDLVPLDPSRWRATAAERLFGYVEEDPPEGRPVRALASRLRFSDARVREGVKVNLGPRVKLRVLASPKPPSPSFYFLRKDGSAAPKATFIPRGAMSPKVHVPRGRKVYFHHDVGGKAPWVSDTPQNHPRNKQRLWITPIPAKTEFFFHIDFDNLLDDELDLLCFSLSPSERFLHKLGLGKSLGLGSIRIEVLGLLMTERQARYESLSSPRFVAEAAFQPEVWPERYSPERTAALSKLPSLTTVRKRAAEHATRLHKANPAILAALLFLGERRIKETDVLINTPLTEGAAHQPTAEGFREERTYAWFADMYRTAAQSLPALESALPLIAENAGRAQER